MADATAYYEKREAELGAEVMREVERQVMLRIIDQRWREHLEEMDYLQEGINLRAMGQKDPLTEWQREGFEMFGAMMKGIAQDFVKYVMHVQVVRNEAPEPQVQNVQQSSSDDLGLDRLRPLPVPRRSPRATAAESPARRRQHTVKQQTVVKDEFEKTPRNAPCPCGIGQEVQACATALREP